MINWSYKGKTFSASEADAVRNFQSAAGISADGKFGANTSAKLIQLANDFGLGGVANTMSAESRASRTGPVSLRFMLYMNTLNNLLPMTDSAYPTDMTDADFAQLQVSSGSVPWVGPAHSGGASTTAARPVASAAPGTGLSPRPAAPLGTNPSVSRGLPTWAWGLIAVGGVAAVGGGVYYYTKRQQAKNRGAL